MSIVEVKSNQIELFKLMQMGGLSVIHQIIWKGESSTQFYIIQNLKAIYNWQPEYPFHLYLLLVIQT
jgi:hypothetical protein